MTVLFVPGFREYLGSRDYQKTISAIKSLGYKVKFVPINWSRTTINDWVNELNNTYNNYNPKDVILAGFSFGAMTVLSAAAQKNPKQLWLFSLSPYFQEDIPGLKKTWLKYIGKKRIKSFSRLSFNKLSRSINCKTFIFAGEKEMQMYPALRVRCEKAARMIHPSKYIIVPNTKHDVGDKRYTESIKENIARKAS